MHKNLSKLNFVLPVLYELETYWKNQFFSYLYEFVCYNGGDKHYITLGR